MILECDWGHGGGDECLQPPRYYVVWDETSGNHLNAFAGFFCEEHTAALRGGQSPFWEWSWKVTIQRVRTIESQLHDARGSWG